VPKPNGPHLIRLPRERRRTQVAGVLGIRAGDRRQSARWGRCADARDASSLTLVSFVLADITAPTKVEFCQIE